MNSCRGWLNSWAGVAVPPLLLLDSAAISPLGLSAARVDASSACKLGGRRDMIGSTRDIGELG